MTWDPFLDGWIIAIGVLSACSCALLGNYLVLRRMSLMGDAISHAVLPGIAAAFIISESRASVPMFVGAAIVGVLTAVLTQVIRDHGKVEHGAAMGVVFSILFAVGLIMIRRGADHVDLDPGCVLYGNITLMPLEAYFANTIPAAAKTLGAVLIANMLFVGLFYKELKISSFDPMLATTLGINATVMHYILMVMVAITTVANFEAVGSILVIAMLIVPPAAAYLMTDRFGVMILLSLCVAALSAVLGHLLAIWGPGWLGYEGVDVNTAAMIAVMAGCFLGMAFLLSPQHGLLGKLYDRWVLSLRIVREDILGMLYRWQEFQPQPQRAMLRQEVLTALGGSTLLNRHAMRSLAYKRYLIYEQDEDQRIAVRLSQAGSQHASQLVRSHRLWESYLARHFHLPLDHLHSPAERVEHFISEDMRARLGEHLQTPEEDPHGKKIPPPSAEETQ